MTHPTPNSLPPHTPMAESFGQVRFFFRRIGCIIFFSVAGSRAEVKFPSKKTPKCHGTLFCNIKETATQGPGKRHFPPRAASHSTPNPTTPPPAPRARSTEKAHTKVKTRNFPPGVEENTRETQRKKHKETTRKTQGKHKENTKESTKEN